MPNNEDDPRDNNIEIEILPPEPGHNRSDAHDDTDRWAQEEAPFAPRPWQILLFRVARALIIMALLVAAFFLGTVVLAIVAVALVIGALWLLWLRATGRGPAIHVRRF